MTRCCLEFLKELGRALWGGCVICFCRVSAGMCESAAEALHVLEVCACIRLRVTIAISAQEPSLLRTFRG